MLLTLVGSNATWDKTKQIVVQSLSQDFFVSRAIQACLFFFLCLIWELLKKKFWKLTPVDINILINLNSLCDK